MDGRALRMQSSLLEQPKTTADSSKRLLLTHTQHKAARNKALALLALLRQLAACKTLASMPRKGANAPCSYLSIVQFATGPKRSMGHFLGGEKCIFFYSRY